MALSQDLRAALTPFDGKATSLLGEAEAAFGRQVAYIEALITLIGDAGPYVGSGATWLLKSFLEHGGALSAEQTQTLIAALPSGDDAHWSTQLHLCQSMRYLDLSGVGASSLRSSSLWLWVEPLLTHKRPFLRAWSLDALAHLAREHKAYQADFEKALQRASKDEAASVRARAHRSILD
ncbi:MAG: hypothetical protein AAF251_05835 [Pseudomonadota bacterium]